MIEVANSAMYACAFQQETWQPCSLSHMLLMKSGVTEFGVRLQPSVQSADCTDLSLGWNHWPD